MISCRSTCVQAVYGDLGYGVPGNAIETRAQLDRVFNQYDITLHVGVRVPPCGVC